MEVLLKVSLILSSALSYGLNFTPPNGGPKALPPRSTLKAGFNTEMREWILVFLIKYNLPIQIKTYYLVSINEISHILSSTFPSLSIRSYFPSLVSNTGISITLLLGALLSITGCVLCMFCFRALSEGFTFELVPAGKLANNPTLIKSPKLVTHGPYSIVRHPSYVGCWLNVIGSAMVHSWILETGIKGLAYAWLVAAVGGITVLLMRMDDEDALMKEQFGSEWEAWSKVVRYKLIPGVY
uniref:Protein-S-isoprenylcysteine O-methyltransferase n=1 Tax=Moniliophthora roreri TaxID=221103 RepID=A0A0W0EXP0_MONRR